MLQAEASKIKGKMMASLRDKLEDDEIVQADISISLRCEGIDSYSGRCAGCAVRTGSSPPILNHQLTIAYKNRQGLKVYFKAPQSSFARCLGALRKASLPGSRATTEDRRDLILFSCHLCMVQIQLCYLSIHFTTSMTHRIQNHVIFTYMTT